MSTLYDTWDKSKQAEFNPDGTMREEIRNQWIADGRGDRVLAIEYRNKQDIAYREKLDRKYFERCGKTLTDMQLENRRDRAEYDRQWNSQKRLQQDIANGEPLESLGEYVDQDDNYDLIDF